MTEVKKGDRVRVTIELTGTVVAGAYEEPGNTWFRMRTDDSVREIHSDEGWVVEKLPDPEPVWVNGDVVLVTNTGGVFVRSGGAWRHAQTNQWTAGNVLTARWAEGVLKILYKVDGGERGDGQPTKAQPAAQW